MNLLKRLVAALLLKLILFAMTWQLVTISFFYINQASIEAEYCVNKDKPELNCHGKCHLKKLLIADDKKIADTEQVPASSNLFIMFQAFSDHYETTWPSVSIQKDILRPYIFNIKSFDPEGTHSPPEIFV